MYQCIPFAKILESIPSVSEEKIDIGMALNYDK